MGIMPERIEIVVSEVIQCFIRLSDFSLVFLFLHYPLGCFYKIAILMFDV